jgi:hypothetical protein
MTLGDVYVLHWEHTYYKLGVHAILRANICTIHKTFVPYPLGKHTKHWVDLLNTGLSYHTGLKYQTLGIFAYFILGL